MRPYCTPRDCMGYGDLLACDGCRLEAACNAMGIALCIVGVSAAYARVMYFEYSQSSKKTAARFGVECSGDLAGIEARAEGDE